MLNLTLTFDDLLKLLDQLSDEQKQIAREHLEARAAETQKGQRILGMHPGAIWTSEDFDDPLPDEFWLGEDA